MQINNKTNMSNGSNTLKNTTENLYYIQDKVKDKLKLFLR